MKTIIMAVTMTIAATSVSAQDFYLGGTVDYATPHSGDEQTSVGLMGGVEFGAGGPLSFAAQAEYSTPRAATDNYDAARLRGLASYDLGDFAAVGGVGVTRYTQSGTDFNGFNFSLGVDAKLGTGPGTVRAELVRDLMDDFGTDVTTARIGYKYNF